MSAAPSVSVRLPQLLKERVQARARIERRTFSNTLRVLVEAGLAQDPGAIADVDPDEVERLADIARVAIEEAHGRSAAA
jgi:hypothetical protein